MKSNENPAARRRILRNRACEDQAENWSQMSQIYIFLAEFASVFRERRETNRVGTATDGQDLMKNLARGAK